MEDILLTSFGLLRNILEENRGSLDQLDVDVSVVHLQDPDEVLHHIVLTKQIKISSLVLFREDDILRQVPDDLNQEMLIGRIDVVYFLKVSCQRSNTIEEIGLTSGLKNKWMDLHVILFRILVLRFFVRCIVCLSGRSPSCEKRIHFYNI